MSQGFSLPSRPARTIIRDGLEKCVILLDLQDFGTILSLTKKILSRGAIILKDKELEDHVKLERREKRAEKIIARIKNNIKCKGYISRICIDHIQQEFQAVKTDLLAQNLLE